MSNKEEFIETPELKIRILANGIHIYRLTDWSESGLQQWESHFVQRLETAERNIYSIYDMRHFSTVSRSAFGMATRLESHPKSGIAYSVALLSNRRVALLVNSLIRMRRERNRNAILASEEESIAWLLEKQQEHNTL